MLVMVSPGLVVMEADEDIMVEPNLQDKDGELHLVVSPQWSLALSTHPPGQQINTRTTQLVMYLHTVHLHQQCLLPTNLWPQQGY